MKKVERLCIDQCLFEEDKISESGKLLERLEILKKYLNVNTMEYLKSILNLELSVLQDKDINVSLSELKLFRDIATYNIFNRTIKILKSLPEIDINKLSIYLCEYSLTIYYKVNENDCFCIFDANFDNKTLGKLNEPYLHVFETNHNRRLGQVKSDLEHTSCISFGNDVICSGPDDSGIYHTDPVVGGPNSIKRFENERKISNLQEETAKLCRIGDIQDRINELVLDNLLNDWNLKLEFDKAESFGWMKIKKLNK